MRTLTPTPTVSADLRRRSDAGWFFAASFRPFFVGAPLLALVTVPLWVHVYLTGADSVAGMPAMAWHAHEMVFGYLPAVMAGYLLSATPNWSGRLPVSGWPLAALFALWLAGRLVPLASPGVLALVANAAFPLAVAAALLREARVKAPRQSRHGLALFPLMAAASLAHRLLATDPTLEPVAARLGVAVAVLLISAIGGRLVPSLTRNELSGRGEAAVPDPYGRFDVLVLLAIAPGLLAWVAAPDHPAAGSLMLAAAALQAVRLVRWRGWRVRQPGVLALHAGYAWVVVGSALAGLAAEPLALVPADAALHAFTAGAIGAMTLAVMARLAVTRGPVGRAATGLAHAALLSINAAALARVAAPLAADAYVLLIGGSAGVFALAQALFVAAQLAGRARRQDGPEQSRSAEPLPDSSV